MKIETHDHLGNPQVIEATRLLVRSAYGDPVACVIELVGPPQCVYVTRSISDPDFAEWLKEFGVTNTVIVDRKPAPKRLAR